ncbi:MAG TPA: CPBP family glutamic-type intramembrane protease [Candidatus Limnocylindrales bacterium]|nr:CPBP family glutamic-type intramembrane protease [Candidatus Limnocylindrales bacterium]
MRSIARRHPFAVFLTIAYAASAVIFSVPLLANTGLGILDLDLPGTAPFILLSAFSLAGAAFITTALAEGRDGVRRFRRRVFHFRVKPSWYAIALALLPATALVAVSVIAGIDPIMKLIAGPAILVGVVIGALVAFVLVNWWEEAAWTGFALDRLQAGMGPVSASVVTTWMQALVHVPLVFVAGGVTDGRVAADQIPFYLVALFVLPIPVRIVLTWLYNSTGRSVPIVGIYHAGLGVAAGTGFIPVLAPGVAPVVVYAGFAALAAVALVATRGRLGFKAQGPAHQTRSEVALAS